MHWVYNNLITIFSGFSSEILKPLSNLSGRVYGSEKGIYVIFIRDVSQLVYLHVHARRRELQTVNLAAAALRIKQLYLYTTMGDGCKISIKYRTTNGQRRARGYDDVDKRLHDTSVNNIISLIQPKSPRVCYAA